MDYSDLLNSVVNEDEGVAKAALAAKQRVAEGMEAVKGALDEATTAIVPTTLGIAGAFKVTPQKLVDLARNPKNLSPSEGYSSVQDAQKAGRIGELEQSQKLATSTEQDLSAANQQVNTILQRGEARLSTAVDPELGVTEGQAFQELTGQQIDAETGLTAEETDTLGQTIDAAKAAGSTLSEGASAIEAGGAGELLAGAEGVSAALDATGALAPVGVVLGIFSFLGTEVASAVEGFKAHHETDNVDINTQNMTQMAYDPTST